MFNFDEVIDRRHSDSLKWHKYADKDIIPLWVADTDFKSPPSITDALSKRVDEGVFGYGGQAELLSSAFIDWAKSRYNWQVEKEWLIFLPGLVPALNTVLRTFTQDNERSICPHPIYPPFMSAAKFANREQSYAYLIEQDNRWVMDLASLEKSLIGNERLLMLCNPQNPGGTAYHQQELLAQLAFAEKHNLIVCSDEIHCDLLLSEDITHIPFASLNDKAANCSITLMSPSKTFNIAGLGASIAIIPNKQLRLQFTNAVAGIMPYLNILSYSAAIAAYTDKSGWLEQQIGYLRNNRDYVYQEINQIKGLKLLPIEASYLAWIDASQLPVENPYHFFEEAGIGLSAGNEFGNDKFVRLNFGCTKQLLEQAMLRMKLACSSLYK